MKKTGFPPNRECPAPVWPSEVNANDSRAGGVFIIVGGGKIELNNTFDERLKLCETEALPSVRATLFGENENRKFHD